MAADLTNLAMEVLYRKSVDQAIELLLRAKAITEKSDANTLPLARILGGLAVSYQDSNRYEEAKNFYEQAIRTYETRQAAGSPYFAACLHQYADMLRKLGDFAAAELIEVRATHADVQSVLASQPTSRNATAGFR